MITAVDTNIILDVLIPDEPHGPSSRTLLERHLTQGKLIICDIVCAELAASFSSGKELDSFLADTGMEIVRSSQRALFLAGSRWSAYARKRPKNRVTCAECGHAFDLACPQCRAVAGKRLHVLADFLIGAHASVHADCLLSRDPGIYKTYFKDVKVIGKP